MNDIGFALMGGMLLGISASLFMLFNGRVAGISGILSSVIQPNNHAFWGSVLFSIGVIGGGYFSYRYIPFVDVGTIVTAPLPLICAGLCVGVGTRLANGCTSGHGICGIGRFSIRSIAATAIFMVVAGITVFIHLHIM